MPIAKKRPDKQAKSAAAAAAVSSKDKDNNSKDSKGNKDNSKESASDLLRKEGIVATYALNSKEIHRNVRDISVSNLTVTFSGAPLLEEAELTLNYGNRYGFIGRNGCGKSTFMRVIGARCFPIAEGIDIFHLSEEIEATDMTAKEAVMSVDEERAKLEAEAEQINEMLVDDAVEDSEELQERLSQIYERLEELDAASAEARASKILAGLGFTPEKQAKKTRDFSGGWRMRIALARALFLQPTLLLLDEPTNHLDMEAVVWLEDYLSKWTKILFMVSHSQDFMNSVCTHIVNLNKQKLVYYSGNYDSFVKTRGEKEEEQEKRFKSEQDQIQHMKDYVARFGQGNAKMAKQAQSKEKILDKMLRSGLTEKVQHEKALDFFFIDPSPLSPPVLQCNDISFGYPGCEILYEGVDFGIDLDSRVALVGPNGAGKSTLLKLMTGDLLPVTGAVRPHPHLRISKFTQHFIDVLDMTQNPLDYFMQLFPDMNREDARKFIGRYGITGNVQTQVMAQLSDGQKSRVVLAKMAKEVPHLLFLDEPTNHLDMESIDSLAKAINTFTGGMMLVSHDMRLISQVAKEIWLCDNHTVTKYVGEISDFKMQIRRGLNLEGAPNSLGKAPEAVKLAPPAPAKKAPAPSSSSSVKPPAAPSAAAASAASVVESEEEKIKRARAELADLAIARQRARKAEAVTASSAASAASAATDTSTPPPATVNTVTTEEGESLRLYAERKEAEERERVKAENRLKRKAEKDAIAAREAAEEEERQRRREEKLKDIEDAKRLREEQNKKNEEWLANKAAKEAQIKAAADEAAEQAAKIVAEKKAAREDRRRLRAEAKAAAHAEAILAAERAVLSDPWTQEQQIRFENALLDYPGSVEKNERWTKIAAALGNVKTKNQCLARYRYIKELVIKRLAIETAAANADYNEKFADMTLINKA